MSEKTCFLDPVGFLPLPENNPVDDIINDETAGHRKKKKRLDKAQSKVPQDRKGKGRIR